MSSYERYYLGIDIGTHESKGVLIDSSCRVVSFASTKHGLDNPRPGWFEHDAEGIWWKDFCLLSKRLLALSGISPQSIGCIGASGLGCDCVPVDENCTPLHKAVLYGIDSRATGEVKELTALWGNAGGEIPSPLCSSSIAPKILWFKHHYPEIHASAYKFLTASSYLTAKLTGHFCMDKYLATSWAPLYQLTGMNVNEELCSMCCQPHQLPELSYATDIAGSISSQAAYETGLAEGTPVLTGTGDSGAEAISAGVFQPGDIMVQIGSTCFLIYYTDHMLSDPRIWPGPFIVPGSLCITAGTNTAGTLTQWYRDNLFPELLATERSGGENAFSAMAAAIKDIPAGSNGLITLPYFSGERTPINDPCAKGMIFGLQIGHNRHHIYKSALEGIGYSIAQHFAILEENHLPVNKIVLTGGGTKNNQWTQIIADILGREVYLPKVTIGAAYGDALMSALADGVVSDWRAMDRMVERGQTITPILANHQVYRSYLPIFGQLYRSTSSLMHLL